jgi:hypothetical protein
MGAVRSVGMVDVALYTCTEEFMVMRCCWAGMNHDYEYKGAESLYHLRQLHAILMTPVSGIPISISTAVLLVLPGPL